MTEQSLCHIPTHDLLCRTNSDRKLARSRRAFQIEDGQQPSLEWRQSSICSVDDVRGHGVYTCRGRRVTSYFTREIFSRVKKFLVDAADWEGTRLIDEDGEAWGSGDAGKDRDREEKEDGDANELPHEADRDSVQAKVARRSPAVELLKFT